MHEQLTKWWEGISLRSKITGVTVLVVTIGLMIVGAGTITVLQQTLVGQVDRQLLLAADELRAQGDRLSLDDFDETFTPVTGSSVVSSPLYFGAVDASGALIDDNVTDARRSQAPDASRLTLSYVQTRYGEGITVASENRSGQWRLAAFSLTLVDDESEPRPATLVIGADLAPTNGIIGNFASIFLGFGLVAVILSAALTRLLVSSTFRPLRDVEATAARFAGGDFSQRLGGATPNTEVGRLNRSLNTMLSRIDRAFADRAATIAQMRRFVGDASHELRTPLVSLRGYAELYRMGAIQKEADVAQAMERIEKEAIRMSALVGDLLALARLDEAKPLEPGPVDLVLLARDAALDTMAGAPDREVQIVIDEASATQYGEVDATPPADPDLAPPPREPRTNGRTVSASRSALARLRGRRRASAPEQSAPLDVPVPTAPGFSAVVLGEENKLRQVVTNLVGNAMRFTDAGSPIELVVGLDLPAGMATIAVVDHGEGIPAELKEKIFQRFFRADSSRTRDTGGSGLGLAIVASIVDLHGGRVEVLDTPGGGATFRVALPLLPRVATPADAPDGAAAPSPAPVAS
ncbi:HAMP domain-containing sensor histidine kinase [Microcella daejeonensis]|uniref:sensor histidine kinase n=1 Tax=Microcella daejeonensis TaxID=2994971 RepID=UPI00226DAA79|nr:HAMP domain-containing sensor histidine kinase [Microcella daejeonensis]WAB84949.1 HAMP domain-containing sensor histidine kinase [Microcella daejeonensis]